MRGNQLYFPASWNSVLGPWMACWIHHLMALHRHVHIVKRLQAMHL
jgi:hypothetical protein